MHDAFMKDVLFVSSFKQDIFSVERPIAQGASLEFKGNSGVLRTGDGTRFKVVKQGKLYFLNCIVDTKNSSGNIQERHEARSRSCTCGNQWK